MGILKNKWFSSFMTTHLFNVKFQNYFCSLLAFLLTFSLGMSSLDAAEQNVNPGINEYYYDAEFKHWVSVFERPGREVYDKREAIVAQLGLKPGMRVADIGAGTGFYTHMFAEQVGSSGRVYAVDISKNFIQHILQASRSHGLHNVEGIVNTQQESKLPADSVDLAFVCDTYHHFEYPRTMLASIHQALRPDGQLVIIDFHKKPGVSSGWVMSHVRANDADVIKEVESAGFKLIEQPELLHENFFLQFTKTSK
jgi:predicted methyltransferase